MLICLGDATTGNTLPMEETTPTRPMDGSFAYSCSPLAFNSVDSSPASSRRPSYPYHRPLSSAAEYGRQNSLDDIQQQQQDQIMSRSLPARHASMRGYTTGSPTYASVVTERAAAVTPVGMSIATVNLSLEDPAAMELAFSQEQKEVIRVLDLLDCSWPICQYKRLITLDVNDGSAGVQRVLQEVVGSCQAQMRHAQGWGVTAGQGFNIPDNIQVGLSHKCCKILMHNQWCFHRHSRWLYIQQQSSSSSNRFFFF